MSSPQMMTMFGLCCCCATAGTQVAVVAKTEASRPDKSVLAIDVLMATLRRDAKRPFASPTSAGKIQKTPKPAPWRPRRAKVVATAGPKTFSFCIVLTKGRAGVRQAKAKGEKHAR